MARYDFFGSQITGSGGTSATVTQSGRTKAEIIYRGGIIHCKTMMNNTLTGGSIAYTFPTGDSDRERRVYVKFASTTQSVDIPDGTLADGDGLVFDASTGIASTKSGTWGNIALSSTEYLLLYSSNGNLSGELSKYCVFDGKKNGIPIVETDAEQVSSTGSTQGIIIMDGTVYTCSHAPDDHSAATGKIGTKSHNICHMNAPSYDTSKDALIVGNGSKDYTLSMKGWIFPNWSTQFASADTLDFNTLEKIEIDFPAADYPGEYKCQLCWGYDDYIYMSSCDSRVIRKLMLNKTDGVYDGTYTVVGTWISETTDIVGGMLCRNGSIYFGVKGDYGIRKCTLKTNGTFESKYISVRGKVGDMQGIAIDNGKLYVYTDYRGYAVQLGSVDNDQESFSDGELMTF